MWGSTMESNDVAKAAMNEIFGILFSPINIGWHGRTNWLQRLGSGLW